jgi:hypothetical protein
MDGVDYNFNLTGGTLANVGAITSTNSGTNVFTVTPGGGVAVGAIKGNGAGLANLLISALQTNGFPTGTAYVLTNNGTGFTLTNAPSGIVADTSAKASQTADEGGVALAAIQGLNQKLEEKDAEIQDLKHSVAELRKMVQSLAERK